MNVISILRGMIIKCLPNTISEDKINIKMLPDCGYTCDVAIVFSSILKKDTLSLCKRIKNSIEKDIFREIVISDDGMLTFYLKKDFLISCIKDIVQKEKDYGKSSYGKNKKICVECIIGQRNEENIWKTIYLDSLSNIMTYAGYDITSYCYVMDNDGIKSDLEDKRVYFDYLMDKEDLNIKDNLDDTLSLLQRSNHCLIKDDGLWLRTGDYIEKRLTNSDGDYLEFLYLMSYYTNIFGSGYDGIISICSKDDDTKDIRSAIEICNYDLRKYSIKIINTGFFNDSNLINNIRYNVLSGSDKIYDIENTNSMIFNLLRGKWSNSLKSDSTKRDEYAYIIMNKLLEFENIIIWCATRGIINSLCIYLEDLVCLFNNYNSTLECYSEEDKLIAKSVYIVINNIASMLGLILREDL